MSFKESGIKPGWPQNPTADQDHVAEHEALGKFGNKWARPGAQGAGNTPPTDFYGPTEVLFKNELMLGTRTGTGTFNLNQYVDLRATVRVHPFYFLGSAELAESAFPIGILSAENCMFVCAQSDPAPTGSDVTLQIAYNGVDILNEPLAIVANSAPRQQFQSLDFAVPQLAPAPNTAINTLYARIVAADSGDTAGNISLWLATLAEIVSAP